MTSRTQRTWNVALATLFVLLAGGTIARIAWDEHQSHHENSSLSAKVDARDTSIAELSGEVNTSIQQTQKLIDQVEALGAQPVVSPADVPTPAPAAAASDGQVRAAVADYFRRFPIPQVTDAQVKAQVQQQVVAYLEANQPRPGRAPTTGEIARAVAGYLQRHPPPAGPKGETGAAGLSYTDVELDGCQLVFTRSDGQSSRVGPVCGDKGDPGPKGDTGVDGPPGPPGVVQVVTDASCTTGDGYVATTSSAYDADTQTITVTCTRSTAGLTVLP